VEASVEDDVAGAAATVEASTGGGGSTRCRTPPNSQSPPPSTGVGATPEVRVEAVDPQQTLEQFFVVLALENDPQTALVARVIMLVRAAGAGAT